MPYSAKSSPMPVPRGYLRTAAHCKVRRAACVRSRPPSSQSSGAAHAPGPCRAHHNPTVVAADARSNKGVPHAGGPLVERGHGGDHVDELHLVGGRHGDHVGQAGHVRDVEAAGVRRAICAHKARAVHRKAHRQLLQCHVQERGVDRGPRHHALACEARGKRHGMLLRNAHIKDAVRELLLESARMLTALSTGGSAGAHAMHAQPAAEGARTGTGRCLQPWLRARQARASPPRPLR
jgi:hypothetical protein